MLLVILVLREAVVPKPCPEGAQQPGAVQRQPEAAREARRSPGQAWSAPGLDAHGSRPSKTPKPIIIRPQRPKQKVVIQASSRALRAPFWSSGLPLTSWDLLGRSWTPPAATRTRPRHIENDLT